MDRQRPQIPVKPYVCVPGAFSKGADWFDKGRQAEAAGNLTEAVKCYKLAEKAGHDLEEDDPNAYIDDEEVDDDEYEQRQIQQGETEDTCEQTPEQEALLKSVPESLSYSLSPDQKAFLEEHGYLVVKQAVEVALCDELVAEAFERAKKLHSVDQADPSTWRELTGDGFFDSWHCPAYYKIRQCPVLYSIFAQLLHQPKLTVSLDRLCLKPPAYANVPLPAGGTKRVNFFSSDFPIHNDLDLWDLSETKYQCGIALGDCPRGGGGFRCVPGFHKLATIRSYRKNYEAGSFHPKTQAFGQELKLRQRPPGGVFQFMLDPEVVSQAIEVPLEKGDAVIWNSRLPHSNLPNKQPNWRAHCYVRFIPATASHQLYRDEVRRCAESGEKPQLYSTENSTGGGKNWEVPMHALPALTPLGRRVLGLEAWDSE